MTTIELEAKKAVLARSILTDINSEEIVDKMQALLQKLTHLKSPCQLSIEEIKEDIAQSEKDFESGLGISSEEVFNAFRK